MGCRTRVRGRPRLSTVAAVHQTMRRVLASNSGSISEKLWTSISGASVRLWRYLGTLWAAFRAVTGEVGRGSEETAAKQAFGMSVVVGGGTQEVAAEGRHGVVHGYRVDGRRE